MVGQEEEETELTPEEIDDWATVDSSPEDVISESDGGRGSPPSERGSSATSVGGPAGSDSPTAQQLAAVTEDVKEMEQDQGVSQPTLGTGIGNADHEKGSEEVIATVESVVVAPSPAPGSGHGESGHMASPPPAMTLEPGAPPGQEELLMSREVAPTDEPAPESPRMVRWGWGWGAVSGALREVSAGVAKDVMELKESFQAAINVDSDEEGQSEYEEEEEESAEGGDEEPSGSAPPAEAPELTEEERIRQEVLARLEGGDTEFEKGVKALDGQVEHLASGLWGLVGKAGRGVGTFAKKLEVATMDMAAEVAHDFKETMQDVKGLHAVQVASSGLASGRQLLANAERQLEHVGQRAMAILEDGLDEDWQDEEFRPEDATFEQCFYMSGGQGALEEVEALGNEASRLCNRARRNLSPARQSAFERQVTEFAPLFDLSSELVKSSEGGKLRVPRADAYAEVEATKDAAVLLASQLSAAAARLVGGDTEEDARNAPATGEQAAAVLRNMKGEGLSQVAGTASAGVAHLLTLGKSVGAHLFGEPATEHWPAGATSKATALRFVAHQLEADIAAVSAAFGKSLAEADEALMTPFREEAATGGKPQLVLDLEADAAAAAHKLREAFRALMYVVLATAMTEDDEEEVGAAQAVGSEEVAGNDGAEDETDADAEEATVGEGEEKDADEEEPAATGSME
mmetsp:Transcript_30158/g.77992  ORF Transcript_30158/g.77992 Transcript_30158/m.77992 type:complete len:689 (-) Transcript_30158:198-2264(-)